MIPHDRRFELFWALLLLGSATVALLAGWIWSPGPDETVLLAGEPFGAPCAFREATGHACLTCGMTRSWVHIARGHLLTAFAYSPSGASLWLWLVWGGVLATVRIATRRLRLAMLPWKVMVGWTLFWMLGLYLGSWLLRLVGVNPLPPL